MNKPDHSDFLIHWTGCDIDRDKRYFDSSISKNNTVLNRKIIEPYLQRLRYILKYGLWMNTGKTFVKCDSGNIKRPKFSRSCFTELKLSDVQLHAKKFGRLGIGFKRMFVFERMGQPMMYFRPEKDNWFMSPYIWDARTSDKKPEIKDYWACFLKSMQEKKRKSGTYCNYAQFEESEWRIIFSEEIKKKAPRYAKYFKRPKDVRSKKFHEYLNSCGKKPDYLIPLNDFGNKTSRWFSIIIYPSLAVKVAAEADKEIRAAIKNLNPNLKDSHAVRGSASYEPFSKPIEIDLGACRNF